MQNSSYPKGSLYAALALLLPLLTLAGAAQAAMTKAEFLPVLTGALTDQQLSGQTSGGEVLTYEEVAGVAAGGAWRIGITNACLLSGGDNSMSKNYGKSMKFTIPAIVANQGASLDFIFQSQVVNEHQRTLVERTLAKRLATINGDYSDLNASIGLQPNGTYQLTAAYPYGSAASARKRIAFLVSQARFMICDVFTAMEEANFKLFKEVNGVKLGTLSKAQFVALYPLFKDTRYEVQGTASEGQWVVRTNDDWRMWIENHGDRMKLWVPIVVKNLPSADKQQAIIAQLRAIEPFGGAESVEADLYGNEFWVATVHPYEGKTGKQVAAALERFVEKDSDKFYARAAKIVKSNN